MFMRDPAPRSPPSTVGSCGAADRRDDADGRPGARPGAVRPRQPGGARHRLEGVLRCRRAVACRSAVATADPRHYRPFMSGQLVRARRTRSTLEVPETGSASARAGDGGRRARRRRGAGAGGREAGVTDSARATCVGDALGDGDADYRRESASGVGQARPPGVGSERPRRMITTASGRRPATSTAITVGRGPIARAYQYERTGAASADPLLASSRGRSRPRSARASSRRSWPPSASRS